jgi:hypothetical protein
VGTKSAKRPSSTRQPAPKEEKKKKTLKEVAGGMLADIAEKAREERMRVIHEKTAHQEDEVLAMIYGPSFLKKSEER